MKMTEFHYLIIGASQAGLTAAFQIRQRDTHGSIAVVSAEPYLPYKRTKLSKNLIREICGDAFPLYEKEWYKEQRIDLLVNCKVIRVKPSEKKVLTESGDSLKYDKLLIATGASSKRLDIPGAEYIKHLWYRKEAEAIQQQLQKCKSAVVIGAGVEGVELVDQFYQAGLKVTLIGRSKQPMKRWLDKPLREALMGAMDRAGINQQYGHTVSKVEKKSDSYLVHTGEMTFQTDMVAASTGLQPLIEIAKDLSICGQKGLKVNSFLETSEKDIYGAGDVLELPAVYSQGLWHSAEYQASIAAANMTGAKEKLQETSFRLKTEVFGSFFFSQAYILHKDKEKRIILSEKNRSLKVFLQNGVVKAALMWNIPEIAKPLQKLVQLDLTEESFLKKIQELKLLS